MRNAEFFRREKNGFVESLDDFQIRTAEAFSGPTTADGQQGGVGQGFHRGLD